MLVKYYKLYLGFFFNQEYLGFLCYIIYNINYAYDIENDKL